MNLWTTIQRFACAWNYINIKWYIQRETYSWRLCASVCGFPIRSWTKLEEDLFRWINFRTPMTRHPPSYHNTMSAKSWTFSLKADLAEEHTPETWDFAEYKITYIWCGKDDSGNLHGVIQFNYSITFYEMKFLCLFANCFEKTEDVAGALEGIKHLTKYYEQGVFTADQHEICSVCNIISRPKHEICSVCSVTLHGRIAYIIVIHSCSVIYFCDEECLSTYQWGN